MRKWNSWAAPLLGGFGSGLGGLYLSGEPNFPFSPVYATLGGIVVGIFAGMIVWFLDKPNPNLETSTPISARGTVSAESSRWFGFILMIAGIGSLAANHAWVAFIGEELLLFVVAGSFFSVIGLGGIFLPQLLTSGATGQQIHWWEYLIGGFFAVGALALGLYLWLVVY
jgi:hypothetical protein